MNQKQRAWIYCRIDAPEDSHGALKEQRQQLIDYAEQMGWEVVGASEDTGCSHPLGWPGLKRAVDASAAENFQLLLTSAFPRSGVFVQTLLPLFKAVAAANVAIYSPMEGRINVN